MKFFLLFFHNQVYNVFMDIIILNDFNFNMKNIFKVTIIYDYLKIIINLLFYKIFHNLLDNLVIKIKMICVQSLII